MHVSLLRKSKEYLIFSGDKYTKYAELQIYVRISVQNVRTLARTYRAFPITDVEICTSGLQMIHIQNACILVPTVFLRHLKTKFEIPFAFSVFLRFPKTKIKLLVGTALGRGTGIRTRFIVCSESENHTILGKE